MAGPLFTPGERLLIREALRHFRDSVDEGFNDDDDRDQAEIVRKLDADGDKEAAWAP